MHIDPKIKSELKTYLINKMHSKQVPEVTVRAPYRLSESEITSLKDRFPLLKEAKIEVVADDNILAGFIIQFGSNIIDVSVNSKLQTLEKMLYETA